MSHPRLFGTDGVRGAFGIAPLDRATVTALGFEVGALLARRTARPAAVLGGDTRESTPTLCRWLAAGLAAAGARVRFAGTIPTPGIARLVRLLGADAGVAVSASHNPHPDNGIKLIDAEGFKWTPEAEAELEAAVAQRAPGAQRGETADPRAESELAERYLHELRRFAADGELGRLRIALDTAHGAAVGLADRLFRALGAGVELLGDRPNGRNINDGCGSTHPQALARHSRESRCDLGFAFDGDADRVIPVDESGRIWDGDAILYLLARSLADRDALEPRRIVATSMSNLGLEVALAGHGIELERCDVGDRIVVETLRRSGLRLGGEQSGHIVDLALTTSGDGLLTALCVAREVARSGRPLSALLQGFERFPQVLRNVPVREKPALLSLPAVLETARWVERQLGDRGRLVLRYSGTEPLARVMIEGPDAGEVERLAGRLAGVIAGEIGVT